MITISSNFIFSFTNFCVIVILFFWTKLLTLGFFSTTIRALVVAKLVTLGIFSLTSFILALRAVLVVAKLAILDMSF